MTPAYNEQEYIGETLASVSAQRYPNLEHVVVDDGSTDRTPTLLEGFDSNHDLEVIRTENRGQVAALNTGFDAADGEYVAWLNGDDVFFTKSAIDAVVDAFEADETADFAYGMHAVIDGETTFSGVHVPVPRFGFERLKRWCFAAFVFMRRDVVAEYDLNTDYDYAMDYELFLRAADDGRQFTFVNDVLLGYRAHDATKSTTGADQMRQESQALKRAYGLATGPRYYVDRGLDKALLTGLRLYGLRVVLDLLGRREDLVFPDSMGSRRESLMGQLRRLSPTTTH